VAGYFFLNIHAIEQQKFTKTDIMVVVNMDLFFILRHHHLIDVTKEFYFNAVQKPPAMSVNEVNVVGLTVREPSLNVV